MRIPTQIRALVIALTAALCITLSLTPVNTTTTTPAHAITTPTFTLNPSDATASVGEKVSFTVAATGDQNMYIRWQVLLGSIWTWQSTQFAYGPTWSFAAQAYQNGYQIRAVAISGGPYVYSEPATLTVTPTLGGTQHTAPVFTQNPSDLTLDVQDQVEFTALATGTPEPNVYWQMRTNETTEWSTVSGDPAPYATQPTLLFTWANLTQNGTQYRAVATNDAGTVFSDPATLTVQMPPTIVTDPRSITVEAGQQASFTVAVDGSPTPEVTWYYLNAAGSAMIPVPNSSGTTLTFTADASQNGNQYFAVATGAGGPNMSARSWFATLTVTPATTLGTEPHTPKPAIEPAPPSTASQAPTAAPIAAAPTPAVAVLANTGNTPAYGSTPALSFGAAAMLTLGAALLSRRRRAPETRH